MRNKLPRRAQEGEGEEPFDVFQLLEFFSFLLNLVRLVLSLFGML